MSTKNIVLCPKSYELVSAIPFKICIRVLICQLAFFLVSSSSLGSYYLSFSTTEAYSQMTEETLRQGIPLGRISGASR